MSTIKLENAWDTLGITSPTQCQWETNAHESSIDKCKRIIARNGSRNTLLDELHESIMMAHGCVNISEDSYEKYLATKTKYKDEVQKKRHLSKKNIQQLLGKIQDSETALADEKFRVHNLTHTNKYQLIPCMYSKPQTKVISSNRKKPPPPPQISNRDLTTYSTTTIAQAK